MPIRKDATTGRYHIEVCRRGIRIHRVRDTRTQAEALHAKIIRDIDLGEVGMGPERSIAEALHEYLEKHVKHSKSASTTKHHVNRLVDFVKGKSLLQAPEAAQAFIDAARKVYKPATINRSLAALRRACNLAYKWGWINQPVGQRIELLTENNARTVFLTRPEIEKLVENCIDQETKDAVLVAAFTGMRMSEVLSLGAGNIDSKSIRLGIENKTGTPRSIPIVPLIRPALKRLPFTINRRQLHWRFCIAKVAAGMPNIHFHDLRHSTASLLISVAKADLRTVADILGHRSIQTTMRYAHLYDAAKRQAMLKIG